MFIDLPSENLYPSTVFFMKSLREFAIKLVATGVRSMISLGGKDSKLTNTVISIIDDDELVRDAVQGLVRSLGYSATAFASAEDYLQSDSVGESFCLITDVQMPGMGGVELQEFLIAEGNPTPIIFMTAFFDEKVRARVLKAGGCCYLKKPLDENVLVQCLEKALKSAA